MDCPAHIDLLLLLEAQAAAVHTLPEQDHAGCSDRTKQCSREGWGQACPVPDRHTAIHNVLATETLKRFSNVSGIHLTISFFTEVLENKTPERIIVKWEFHLTISFFTEVLESKAPEEKSLSRIGL